MIYVLAAVVAVVVVAIIALWVIWRMSCEAVRHFDHEDYGGRS